MEDTLITFKTAKLAKEKGFIIKTKYSWYVPDNSKPIIEKHKPDGLYYLSCPTQSLLAKWLREKHGILTNPIFSYNDGKWVIHIESIKLAKIDDNSVLISGIDFQPSLFNTYEEALEIGLQESLKLI